MHSTLPSSLARLMQPSRATSKKGLFIALGTMTKRYVVWASAGHDINARAAAARRIRFIGFLHFSMPIPDIFRSGSGIDGAFLVSLRPVSSNHPRAYPVDQNGQDDDHAHQRLLPVGIDLREHEPVADHLEQHTADDGRSE